MHAVVRTGRVAIVAFVVVILTAAGCSGGDESPAAQRSADRWANTVCTDLARWIAVAESASPAATAEEALRLRSGIVGTEAPGTDDGLAAQSEMEKLATAIEQEVRAADPAQIATTATEARAAVGAIRGLTPGGAVETALEDVRPCRDLRR
jgi:hypothetical protein